MGTHSLTEQIYPFSLIDRNMVPVFTPRTKLAGTLSLTGVKDENAPFLFKIWKIMVDIVISYCDNTVGIRTTKQDPFFPNSVLTIVIYYVIANRGSLKPSALHSHKNHWLSILWQWHKYSSLQRKLPPPPMQLPNGASRQTVFESATHSNHPQRTTHLTLSCSKTNS